MPPTHTPLFTAALRAIHQKHLSRLHCLYAGDQPDTLLALDGQFYSRSHGLSGINEIDMLEDPRAWLNDVMVDMAAHQDRLADEVTFRPAVIELDALGVHIMDALFGAQTRFHGDQVWSEELPYDLDDLQPPDLAHSPLLEKTVRLAELAAQAALDAGDGLVFVATPVFACAVNISINLFGERMLEALHTRPESARRVLRLVNDTILAVAQQVSAAIPDAIRRNSVAENRLAPAGVGQFDGCATQLVSGRDYASFFAPLDAELMALTPHGALMHLCGSHKQHLGTWAAMPGLRAVQLNDRAMDDLELYYTRLRPNTIFYLSPSQSVPLERILQITAGRRVILQATLNEPIPVPASSTLTSSSQS